MDLPVCKVRTSLYLFFLSAFFIMESCNLNSKTQLKFMQSLTGLSSGSSATTGTTTSTVAAPSFTNLLNKGLLETGFVIGAATGTISKVEISIDS
ncbi:MAG TPA: hypothetical protein PK930_25880, partial [Leptospiraceae bacterium]|nr:hypothetical protein [Leptospiraceae bacterium]